MWLWPATTAMQVGAALWLTRISFFFQDDFLFLEQARTQRMGLTYLREGLFEHFSPVSRVLDKVVALGTPPSFGLARVIEMGFYAGTVAAFAWVAVTIMGRRWSAFALTLIFGQSLFLMRLLMWWTATANILPTTCFGLLAIGFYLRWRQSGSAWRLVASLLAFAGALLDYEDAMLIPVWLVLIQLVTPEDKLTLGVWLRRLWREKWAWLGYAVLDAAALANFLTGYYFPVARPTLGQLGRFLELELFEGFVPALLGLKDPQLAVTDYLPVVLAVDLAALGVIGFVVWRRKRAWRCVAACAVVYLLCMVPLGLDRITLFGTGIAQELYYQQSLQAMFWVLAALTLSLPRRDRRSAPPARHLTERVRMRARLGVVLVLVAAYTLAYVSSVNALEQATPEPAASSQYVNGIIAAASRMKAETGEEPNLLDLTVPPGVVAAAFFPFNRYDFFLDLIDPDIRIDQGGEIFSVSPSGSLVSETFHSVTGGDMSAATVSNPDGSGREPAAAAGGGEMCIPDGTTFSRITIPLAKPLELATVDAPLYGVSVHYVESTAVSVGLIVVGPGEAASLDEAVPHQWQAGVGSDVFPLFASGFHEVSTLTFAAPPGSCISTLSVGEFTAAG